MMKKLYALVAVLLLLCLLSVGVAAGEEALRYTNGEQIELYLGADGVPLPTQNGAQPASWGIDDETVARVADGVIIPVSEGFTYITCVYENKAYIYNVIVHAGLKEITQVYVDNQLCQDGTYKATIGQTYQLGVDSRGEIDFSQVRIRLKESYELADAEDFVSIDEKGRMTVWGIGDYDIIFQSATNRQDPGYVLHVNSNFHNEMLYAAVSEYFIRNDYDLMGGVGVFTKAELAVIDELVFPSLSDLNTEAWASFLPKLQKITFDLRETSWTGTMMLPLGSDSYRYELIGKAGTTYELAIASRARDTLTIGFSDFSMKSAYENALNFEQVANTTIRFDGQCAVTGGDASAAYNGYMAISARNLVLEIAKDAKVTLQGGRGGSETKSGSVLSRQGGTGIQADDLTVKGIGFSTETALTVQGGIGGNGASSGESGGAGGIGIHAQKVHLEGELSVTVIGGDGGDGKAGSGGSTNSYVPGQASAGKKGATGANGTGGQAGGSGGHGSTGLQSEALTVQISTKLVAVGGNGGDGATGGQGQTGGRGGKGGNTTGWNGSNGGNGGTGGQGGPGGQGGNAGNGALAIVFSDTTKIDFSNCPEMDLTHGYGGSAGSGGMGGTGGRGGNGGDDKHSGISDWGEGPLEGYGGQGGSGGSGGSIGQAATPVRFYNLPNIHERIAVNPNPISPQPGSKGSSGGSGTFGSYGSKDSLGTGIK